MAATPLGDAPEREWSAHHGATQALEGDALAGLEREGSVEVQAIAPGGECRFRGLLCLRTEEHEHRGPGDSGSAAGSGFPEESANALDDVFHDGGELLLGWCPRRVKVDGLGGRRRITAAVMAQNAAYRTIVRDSTATARQQGLAQAANRIGATTAFGPAQQAQALNALAQTVQDVRAPFGDPRQAAWASR